MDISSLTNVQDNHKKYAHLFEDTSSDDLINTETFFNLLIAEMSNQDPLEPTSNTEFISQLAQFTALQSQQENVKYSTANYASSLVGKQLTVNTGEVTSTSDGYIQGICTGVTISGTDVKVTVNGTQYLVSSVTGVSEAEQKADAEYETDITKASALIGKEVMVKVKDEDGNEYYDSGIVSSVEVNEKDGRPQVVLNDYVYYLEEIVLVKEPVQTQSGKENTDEMLSQMLDMMSD